MTSRIQADLKRLDGVLRLGPSRILLKGGSADTWNACDNSLQAVLPVLEEWALADRNGPGAAAIVMHWRKSGTSKKLLALLRAVVEEAPSLAPVDATSPQNCAVRHSITAISFFWQRTQHSTTAWPAMREWLFDQGGVQNIWTALAWCMSSTSGMTSLPSQEGQATGGNEEPHRLLSAPFYAVLVLTLGLADPRMAEEVFEHRGFISALQLLLSSILPRAIAAGCGPTWKLGNTLSFIATVSSSPVNGHKLAAQLHRPLLVSWPYLIAELRRMSQTTMGPVLEVGISGLIVPLVHVSSCSCKRLVAWPQSRIC